MHNLPPIDFQLLVADAENALGEDRGALIERYHVPHMIRENGSRFVWAGDVVKAMQLRFPNLAFAKMRLQKSVRENG